MSARSYRKGVHRYTEHTCDGCGATAKVRGTVLPPHWRSLEMFSDEDSVICLECIIELSEMVELWKAEQQARFPKGRAAGPVPLDEAPVQASEVAP